MDDSYGKRLGRVAWKEYRSKWWSGYRVLWLLAGALVWLASIICGIWSRGANGVAKYIDIMTSSAFLLGLLLTYLYSRRKGAEALDAELRTTSGALQARVRELEQAAIRDPINEQRDNNVHEWLAAFSDDELSFTRWLVLSKRSRAEDWLKSKVDRDAMNTAMSKLRDRHLVIDELNDRRETTAVVNPEYHDALARFLIPPKARIA